MTILGTIESESIRKKYISSFIDTKSEVYINKIKKLHNFEDGLCYTGYLWDCYKNCFPISENECNLFLYNHNNIYIMWDIHSAERIFTPNYWKFGKKNIIYIKQWNDINYRKELPEDIYVFDNSFQWSIAFTHETDLNENRYCVYVYNTN